MNISDKGLTLVKHSEGLRLKAYRCPAGILTIGYGHTGSDVKPGQIITEAKADELLRNDVARFEDAVGKMAGPTTQGQFDALVSFAFNLGLGKLMSSTLLKKHKAGDYRGAAEQFLRWDRAGGVVLIGLSKRRAAEAALYAS